MNAKLQSWLFGALVLLVAIFVLRELIRISRGPSKFRLDDLLIDPKTGVASPVRFVYILSFLVASAVVVYGAVIRSLSDLVFTTYCGTFAVTLIAKIIGDATVDKAAAAPDPAPVSIDRVVNMSAGDSAAPPPASDPPPAPAAKRGSK